jgi:hypothetical protein
VILEDDKPVMRLRTSLLLAGILAPAIALAQFDPHLIPTSGTIGGCNFMQGFWENESPGMTWACIPQYIAFLIQTIFSFIGTLCLIQIIWAGYEMSIGSLSGDKEAGKNRMQHALIGLAFSLFVYLIVNMVVSIVT